jgi:hypothetical protein
MEGELWDQKQRRPAGFQTLYKLILWKCLRLFQVLWRLRVQIYVMTLVYVTLLIEQSLVFLVNIINHFFQSSAQLWSRRNINLNILLSHVLYSA